MKVQLTLGKPSLNGYMVLDPLANPNQNDRIQADPTNLDAFVDANECSEFLSLEILDHVPIFIRPKVLNHWLTKISHGGTITISATDMNELSRLIQNGQLNDIVSINNALYSTGQNVWLVKKSYVPLQQTIEMIMSTGQFNIEHVKFEGFQYFVTARRK